jgi:hypothetical protein
MPQKADVKVVVVWLTDLSGEYVNLLTCREGVRVFKKNRVDGRAGNPQYFHNLRQALRHMVVEGGGPQNSVQVPLDEASRHGLLSGENLVHFY